MRDNVSHRNKAKLSCRVMYKDPTYVPKHTASNSRRP